MSTVYWQVAAGSSGRDYWQEFKRWGMAFVGGSSHLSTMEQVKPGDVIILKKGVKKIRAAGTVVSRGGQHRGKDKEWLQDFDGWDLRGYCYVDWHFPDDPIETSGLTRTTIQRTPSPEHHQIADELIRTVPVEEPDGYNEPCPVNEVSDDEILKFLIERGLRPGDADDLTATLRRIRLLAEYYQTTCKSSDIREHETRSFLVVPLLLSLGWAEQQVKIEYPAGGGRVDLLCLSQPQHTADPEQHCHLILEAKDFSVESVVLCNFASATAERP